MNELMKHLDEMKAIDKFSESEYDIQCKINEELGRNKASSKEFKQLNYDSYLIGCVYVSKCVL